MYQVVDHIHSDYHKRFATEYEAKIAAFKVARMQSIFNNARIHLSVMSGRKQITEINIKQREGGEIDGYSESERTQRRKHCRNY